MKILLTGGGTGGHFYPIIAVAQSLRKIIRDEKLIDATMYYMAPSPYDEKLLFENSIIYKYCAAGKVRRYFSLLNILDAVKTGLGVLKATLDIFTIFPDVVFSKGGYVSFPVLFAARLFGVPVVIHESDSKPGKVNLWSSKFAKRIAISYPQAAAYFPKDKVALTGNPIRKELMTTKTEGAREYWNLDEVTPLIVILGGSQGSKKINDALIDALQKLVENYYIIHQTGKDNLAEVTHTANVVLNDSLHRDRYKPRAYLNDLDIRTAAGASSLIISRAGSTIFEIAMWKKPSIIIPIPEEVSHDQRSNAFSYASTGACSVIEEANLTSNILCSEINRIIMNPDISEAMSKSTEQFIHTDASDKIAREIINIAMSHYK